MTANRTIDLAPNPAGEGFYIEPQKLTPIGDLKRHPNIPGCWIGTLAPEPGGRTAAIVIHETQWPDGSDKLKLFHDPERVVSTVEDGAP